MKLVTLILLSALIICSVAVGFTKNLLSAVIISGTYSLIMSIIWMVIESPDLAITEAAVGAGVTNVLYYMTLKKTQRMEEEVQENDK